MKERADILINALRMYSGIKADLYPVRDGNELRQSTFQQREKVDYGSPIGKVYSFARESHPYISSLLWAQSAIETLKRYCSYSQVKEE